MITISAYSCEGTLLAKAQHGSEALLRVDRAYQPGDRIEIVSDEKHLIVQMDATILPGEVYLPEGKTPSAVAGIFENNMLAYELVS